MEDSMLIIENDIPRTFPTWEFYNQDTREGSENVEKLRTILQVFTMMRPDIGYVQGMSYLAAFILSECPEYISFVLFYNLITKGQILSFYTFKQDVIMSRLKYFRQAFMQELPELCEYFEEEKVDPRTYVYEWVMTMFTRALEEKVCKRLWDVYFLDGFPSLIAGALAILKLLQGRLLYADIEDIMKTLKSTMSLVADEHEFAKTMGQVKLSEWVYEEL